MGEWGNHLGEIIVENEGFILWLCVRHPCLGDSQVAEGVHFLKIVGENQGSILVRFMGRMKG